jgi:hypothetical protein
VPEKILKQLHERSTDRTAIARFGEGIPAIAFSQVWHFGDIIKTNWNLFENEFITVGLSKKDVHQRIESLNTLRRLPGHPVLEHVTNYQFTDEEQRLIEEMDSIFMILVKPFLSLGKR